MQKPFFQMICPLWVAFESFAKVVTTDAPAIMKFDTVMSRAIHALNRAPFVETRSESHSLGGCANECIEPHVYPLEKTEIRSADHGSKKQA
jgi:hypothetical protein